MALSYQPLQPGGATKSKSRAVVLGMLAVVLACCAAVALLRGAPAFVVGSSKAQELTQKEFRGYGFMDMKKHLKKAMAGDENAQNWQKKVDACLDKPCLVTIFNDKQGSGVGEERAEGSGSDEDGEGGAESKTKAVAYTPSSPHEKEDAERIEALPVTTPEEKMIKEDLLDREVSLASV